MNRHPASGKSGAVTARAATGTTVEADIWFRCSHNIASINGPTTAITGDGRAPQTGDRRLSPTTITPVRPTQGAPNSAGLCLERPGENAR
jgi:hypothetical protein